MEKPKEFTMTKREQSYLKDLSDKKAALKLMTEAQLGIAEDIARDERCWWESVIKRVGLNAKEHPVCEASFETGIIRVQT